MGIPFHQFWEPQGTNSIVTWTTVGGRSYVVQAGANLANGFADLSPAIAMPGIGEAATNFAENTANPESRFYRVRLGP